jgi:nitrate reductase NapE component
MNALLRLYPRAWRQRYLGEVTALLEERPPTPGDRLDLVRGAVDAWLHPQVAGNSGPSPEREPIMRPIGIAALTIVGGLLWTAGGIVQHVGGIDAATGYKESTGVMIVTAAMLITAIAAVARAWSGPIAAPHERRAAVAMLLFTFLVFAPYPILAIGFFGYIFATVAFGVGMAYHGVRAGLLLAIGSFVAASFNTESSMALAAVPFGLTWLAFALAGRAARPTIAPAGA